MTPASKKTTSPKAIVISHDAGDAVSILTPAYVSRLEPTLFRTLPEEIVLDPWLYSVTFTLHLRENGAEVVTDFSVGMDGLYVDDRTRLWTVREEEDDRVHSTERRYVTRIFCLLPPQEYFHQSFRNHTQPSFPNGGRHCKHEYPIANPSRITTKKVRSRRVTVIKRRERTYLRGWRSIRISFSAGLLFAALIFGQDLSKSEK